MNFKSIFNCLNLFCLSFVCFTPSCTTTENQYASYSLLPKEIRSNMYLPAKSSYYAKEDFTIYETAVLSLAPGVKFVLRDTCQVYCKGAIISQGSKAMPVEFGRRSNESKFHFTSSKQASIFINTSFSNASIFLNQTSFTVDSCFFNEFDYKEKRKLVSFVLSSYKSNVKLSNSCFTGNDLKEGLGFNKGSCTIVNNKFTNHPDAIELSNIDSALVHNNHIDYSKDDGIDLNNCRNILISNNSIRFSKDKGISIGNSSEVSIDHAIKIRNNTIRANKIGIAVKENAFVQVSNCTFSNNDQALFFSENNPNSKALISVVDSTHFTDNRQIVNANGSQRVQFSNCFSPQYLPGLGNSQHSN